MLVIICTCNVSNLDRFILNSSSELSLNCGVFFLFKIIFPADNPKSKIPDIYQDFPNLYLSKEHLNIAHPNLTEFKNSFLNALHTEKAMELEYVKTSYIRNNKLSSYRLLFFGVLIQVILFIIHLLIYNTELLKLITVQENTFANAVYNLLRVSA